MHVKDHKSVSVLHLLSMSAVEFSIRSMLICMCSSLFFHEKWGLILSWPSGRKCITNYRNLAAGKLNWSCTVELALSLWKRPYLNSTALLLLMLQELSAKWQMATSQRGYCKFRAGSLWKHGDCRSYWLTHASLCGCRRCQGSPSPSTVSLPHFLFQATERNPAQ